MEKFLKSQELFRKSGPPGWIPTNNYSILSRSPLAIGIREDFTANGGFEPPTIRLTVERSTIELIGIINYGARYQNRTDARPTSRAHRL